jgi:flagellar hook-basal body complex protein FliE
METVMIEKATSQANIQSMLETLRSYQAQASQNLQDAGASSESAATSKTGFGQMVSGALEQVNDTMLESRRLQTAYEKGEDLPLTDVVLGMQKSSIAFEATLQIRNKVLKAYEDILNMPV